MDDSRPLHDSQGQGDKGIASFLPALFDDLDGFIEIRVIEDKKGGGLVDRKWFPDRGRLLEDLPELLRLAEERNAAVFYGVLPRSGQGKGKAKDTLPGRVAWADLDFKDYADGEAEARERIKQLPIPPSIIVRSGHGLHLYWLLREATDPKELSELSRGLAGVLGGDHAFDAARLLRLPGTLNRKDPEHPIPVEVEVFEPERAYNPSEIQDALDMLGWDPGRGSGAVAATAPQAVIHEQMSVGVLALLDRHAGLRQIFDGKGKPAVGADGKELDCTSSGYDFSFALDLAKRGITDPSELATAIACRPDGAARGKGPEYIQRTVASALERAQRARGDTNSQPTLDFKVERVRIFLSDKPTFELTVEGVPIRLSSAELKSPKSFSTKFMDALRRVPRLTKPGPWAKIVNGWLEDAETVELGDDASEEAALREGVSQAIEEMSVTEEASDLDRDMKAKTDTGKMGFKANPLLRRLMEQHPELRRDQLCRVLKELGYESGTHRVGGKVVRLWV